MLFLANAPPGLMIWMPAWELPEIKLPRPVPGVLVMPPIVLADEPYTSTP